MSATSVDDPAHLYAGAACAVHVETAASFVCTRCGTFGCGDCVFSAVPAREVCRACAQKGLGEPIPWERRKELGTWTAFWRTVRLASRSPAAFFRTPTIQSSALPAVVHGVASYTVGQVLTYVVMGLLLMLSGGAVALFAEDQTLAPAAAIFGIYGCVLAGMGPFMLVLAPAQGALGVIIAAAASHGVLALFKKTRGSFEDTLRVVSYANAPCVWVFVPLVGFFVYFWMIGLEVIGLRETHRCGSDFAVLAAVGYRVVLFVVAVVGYAALIALLVLIEPPPTGT